MVKQRQHKRRVHTRHGTRRITINRGIKKRVKVSSYPRRTLGGKAYKVEGYSRKKRRLGKKVRYNEVGRFFIAHDELGNIRGSKIKPLVTKRRMENGDSLPQINDDLKNNRIDYRTYYIRRGKLK